MSVFTETYRGSVAAWECDQYGHMNVQFYVARISDAAASTMLAAGMGEQALNERGLGIVAVNQSIDYVQELRAGTLIRMESAIKLIEGRKVVFHHRLFDAETGALAMKADVLGLCFDLKARKTIPFPEEIAKGFARLLMDGGEAFEQLAIPAPEQGCIAGQRSPVNAWECDRMNHMNVQFYLARSAEAVNHIFAALDLGPTRLREDSLMLRSHLHHLLFRREMREGSVGRMISGIRSVSADRICISHRLLNAESGEVSAQVESEIGLMRLSDDSDAPLPDAALLRAEQMAADFAGPEPIKPQTGPRVPELARIPALLPGMLETGRNMVDRWECDSRGIMATRFYMARFSDGIGNLVAGLGLSPMQLHARNVGFAALDYCIHIHRPLRLGQAHYVRSGVLEIRDKTWRFCHVMLDSLNNEVIARAEIVSTTFDLKARKSIRLPDDLRAAIERHLIAAEAAE